MADLPNKVTKEDLEHLVAQSKTTFTNPAGTLTHCVITLPCGYTVTGESACVDPANYDKELGEKYALEQAVEKLWPLEGYLLANDIYRAQQPTSYAARMIFEQSDLREKLDKLCDFLSKPQPSFIDDKEWALLLEQRDYMSEYFNILEIRIKIALSKKLESDAVKKTALAFSEKVTAEVNKCTAPQDPDHELTDDEIKRLNETGSLCDCADFTQYGGDCPIEEGDEFDFGSAVYLLKTGKKVARKGWNGSGMFVYYVPAASYPVERNNLETMGGHFENDMVPYREYLALKTAQGDVATWAPSVSDALATDWCLA